MQQKPPSAMTQLWTARVQARLEALLYDVRFAQRALRRDHAFSLTAIVTLALAIALNVTAFTIMDAMLFRGLPLARRSDRLVYLGMRKPSTPAHLTEPVLYTDFEAWRSQARTFEGLAFGAEGPIAFRDGSGRSLDMSVSRLSANAFGVLGVRPMLGRDFVASDETPGAAPVVILDYRFWESRFNKRADIVGSTVHINGAPATIIGVMPQGFVLVYEQNLWMPLVHTPDVYRKDFEGGVFGRLRDGATVQQARAELDTINRHLEATDPRTNRGVPSVSTYRAYLSPDAPMIYGSLWAAAWFVLLIACANVTNLTLVRTIGRWRELSVRVALGAGLGRMMRQILIESLMLAGVAGALGWWIAKWSVRTWAATTASRYLAIDYTVNAWTLGYLVAICVAVAICCSAAPISRVVQLRVSGALNGDARGVTQGPGGKRLATGLVAAQMTLAIVLLSGAGVLARSFEKVVGADTGVRDVEHVLVGFMRLPSDTYPSAATRLRYFDRVNAQLKILPGMEAESVSNTFPTRSVRPRHFEIEGRPGATEGESFAAQFLTAGSDYFRVMGTSAISGRDFNDGDDSAALPVAVVNQSFAASFWPGEQPLGRRLRTVDRNAHGDWRTVIGVVPNIMQGDATRQSFKPVVYIPFRQQPSAGAFFFVRTSVPPSQVAPAVRAAVDALDADVVVEDFTTLKARFAFDRDYMDLEHSELQKHAAVANILAVIALLLAAIGLYAVIAYSMSQRTKEIGVRMAIGAAAKDIRRLVFREGMLPVATGMFLGLATSLAVNHVLQSQLVGVSPYDPATMAGAPVVLIAVAWLGCQIPARRAVRVDPAIALRCD